VREGLVGIADTRLTSGTETITARKYSIYESEHQSLFLLTSGLRSVRDKALTYFDELMDEQAGSMDRLYKAVNAFATCVRRVEQEDKLALAQGGLTFNIHCLVGGQMPHDREHRLYLLYPQGNWVEIGEEAPYQIVGTGGYGKPILDRTLKYDDPMRFALKVGCLAFDSTRVSASDVDFPLDIVLYAKDTFHIVHHRFQKEDLFEVSNWWNNRLRGAAQELPGGWIEPVFSHVPDARIIEPRTAEPHIAEPRAAELPAAGREERPAPATRVK
jgi:putative proteasome-type protease